MERLLDLGCLRLDCFVALLELDKRVDICEQLLCLVQNLDAGVVGEGFVCSLERYVLAKTFCGNYGLHSVQMACLGPLKQLTLLPLKCADFLHVIHHRALQSRFFRQLPLELFLGLGTFIFELLSLLLLLLELYVAVLLALELVLNILEHFSHDLFQQFELTVVLLDIGNIAEDLKQVVNSRFEIVDDWIVGSKHVAVLFLLLFLLLRKLLFEQRVHQLEAQLV